jgi:hypothetical protein
MPPSGNTGKERSNTTPPDKERFGTAKNDLIHEPQLLKSGQQQSSSSRPRSDLAAVVEQPLADLTPARVGAELRDRIVASDLDRSAAPLASDTQHDGLDFAERPGGCGRRTDSFAVGG